MRHISYVLCLFDPRQRLPDPNGNVISDPLGRVVFPKLILYNNRHDCKANLETYRRRNDPLVFSSLLFLFRFLPAVLILYFIAPASLKNLVLFLVSLVFYAWGEPKYIVLMLLSILVSYSGGRLVDYFLREGRQRAARLSLILSVGIGLSFLIYFKYADLILRTVSDAFHADIPLLNLALPIGISFYTFQTISYIIDVYRGSARMQTNFISYGAYVTMFPQLIAGPIVQYKTIDRQLRDREHSAERFADGVNRFVTGLGKKVLLANNAGALWDYIKVMPASSMPVLTAWLGLAAYTFQIYFDFSAYSDMAIGLGKMFGFEFLENFRYPYMSRSVTEFWRRWHISLGTWFREYVYIPLGGNRVSKPKFIRNILIVWMLTGIWHGADWSFLGWGLYFGLVLLAEKLFLGKYLEQSPGFIQHIYTMLLIMIGWYIFTISDTASGAAFITALFGAGGSFAGGESIYLLYTNALLLVLLILGSTDLPARAAGIVLSKVQEHDMVCVLLRSGYYIVIFLLSVAYLVDATYNPFLYFRF